MLLGSLPHFGLGALETHLQAGPEFVMVVRDDLDRPGSGVDDMQFLLAVQQHRGEERKAFEA